MFKKKIITLFAIVLFSFIYATSEIKAQTVQATITVKDITVDATSEAVDTGIVAMPGDRIEITAEGQTKYGTTETWDYKGRVSDKKIGGPFAFPNAEEFSLVGWIGDRKNYFQVSKTDNYENGKSGTLYFAINDWGGKHYANNAGGLFVTVKLTRYYEIKAEGTDAKAAWGTGLVMINEGDAFATDASGAVTYWKGGDPRDPDGKAGSMATLLAPQINQSALIAKVGDNGNPFKLGKKLYLPKMNQSGWLYVTVNDEIQKTGAYTNNDGELSVNIAVRHPRKTFKNPV